MCVLCVCERESACVCVCVRAARPWEVVESSWVVSLVTSPPRRPTPTRLVPPSPDAAPLYDVYDRRTDLMTNGVRISAQSCRSGHTPRKREGEKHGTV